MNKFSQKETPLLELLLCVIVVLAIFNPLVYSVWFFDFDTIRLPYFFSIACLIPAFILVNIFYHGTVRFAKSWLHYIAIVFLLINLASFLLAINIHESIMNFALLLSCYAIYFLLASRYVPEKFTLKILPVLLIAIATAVAIIGIPQQWNTHILPWLKIEEFKGTFSTLGNINYCGCFAAMFVPFIFAFFLRAKGILWKIIYFLCGAAQLFFLILTDSRAGIVGVGLSFTLIVLILCLKKDPEAKKRFLHPLLGVGGVLLGILAFAGVKYASGGFDAIKAKVGSFFNQQFISNAMRLGTWEGSLEMIKDNFFTGVGIGNFDERFPMYRKDREFIAQHQGKPVNLFVWVENTHNTYLQIFTETGIIGMLFFLALLIVFWIKVFQIIKFASSSDMILLAVAAGGAMLAFMGSGFFNSLNVFVAHLSYFWILLAIIDVASKSAISQTRSLNLTFLIVVVVLISFCYLVYTASCAFGNAEAEHFMRKATLAEQEVTKERVKLQYTPGGRVHVATPQDAPEVKREIKDKKIYYYKEAVKRNPYHWLVRFQLASLYIIGETTPEDMKESEQQYKETLKIRPDHLPSMVKLSEIYIQQQRHKEAKEILERAIKLAPRYWFPYFYMARMYQVQGDIENAIKYFKDTIREKQDFGEAHFQLGVCYLQKGIENQAITHLKKASEHGFDVKKFINKDHPLYKKLFP